jgi:hypothetical protein
MTMSDMLYETEKRFWEFAIPLLESDPPGLEKFINFGYSFYKRYQSMDFITKSLFWAYLGLTFGLAFGIIIS